MTTSSATPSGLEALPWASRSSARRMTSIGTPYCKAIEQTTAESLVAELERVRADLGVGDENFCEPAVIK